MLSKILLRKIKFPLSLRGAFSFCHSRESGNPSSLSLRGAKQRSNLKGFSLIELMIAVVILALAIFGIFQAYSTGFMGMADARDRTVATNYLREMLEDYKNMNFNQIKSEPITLIPDTKFSIGAYVLDLEKIDDVVTLKKVIGQIRWVDRKGSVKTEKVSTILYKKPATSEISDATGIILYASPYYTILPESRVLLTAEIKDENGNTITDWAGDIKFSIITDPPNDPPIGYINPDEYGLTEYTEYTRGTNNGEAICYFISFPVYEGSIDKIEKIQASANLGGTEDVTDTVNIRVTTGAVGIILEPASEEDKILPAGGTATINVTVVKADYITPIAYDNEITLSTDGPGTLSTITINSVSVPPPQTTVTLTSNDIPGVVEITASAPDLDMGYTEVIFTGEPTSILVTPEKKFIYPGEDIDITVTIVDVNNVPVDFDGEVILSADPADYGSFSPNSLDFGLTSLLELESTFTTYTSAPPGETITLQANSDGLSGSYEITILSLLTPKYLKLFANHTSVDLVGGGTTPTITATVLDVSGTKTVTTYNTPITFYAKVVVGGVEEDFNGTFSNNDITPTAGEAEAILSSDVAGTVTITASSGELLLRPEEGVEVVFYKSAHHIVLSAVPLSIEADGHETSIITATVCDAGGNRVANYGNDPDNPKIINLSLKEGSKGVFTDGSTKIDLNEFDAGEVTTSLSSTVPGTAVVTAISNDGLEDNGDVSIELTGNIPTILTLGDVTNWDDYLISFDINVSGSPLYLREIKIEWDNKQAVLDEIVINSPYPGDSAPLTINSNGSDSPFIKSDIVKELVKNENGEVSNISLNFSNAKMKDNNITVTFTDDNNKDYPVSFKVPK